MKRQCLTESLAEKRQCCQCLTKSLAAVKKAIALCQAEIKQFEEQLAEIQKAVEAEIQDQKTASSFNKIPWAGCNNTVNQSVMPNQHMKRPCRNCAWRTLVLPEAEGNTSPTTEIPTPVHEMQYAGRHDDVIQLWWAILRTRKLCQGFTVDSAVRGQWMYFPTCNMRPMCPMPSSHFHSTTASIIDYHGRVIYPEGDGTFVVYHMVPLVHLVSGHPKAPGSSGILKDAGMRNGSYHGDGVGIYAYASTPYELFNPGDGWCMVELKCRPFLTRVRGGSRGRYVLKSDQSSDSVGSLCTDCEVTAVLHMYSTLPDFLTF